MTRRNLTLLLTIVALVALVIAFGFGMLVQRGTRIALERAEAIELQRMRVAEIGPDTYRFFYASNRAPESTGGAPDSMWEAAVDTASSERVAGLRLGHFETGIEPSLGIGMLVDPTDWFQNEEIRLRDVQALGREAFVDAVRAQVDASPHRALLVSVNGFRERFPSALRKTAFLAHVLDVDAPLLVFDWPGDQGSSLRGYRRAQSVARASGAELAELLSLIVDEVAPGRLWLLANSMGAEVVVAAFAALADDPGLRDAETEIDAVVLTAPDVARDGFGEHFRDDLLALADDVTIYVSSNDRALVMSRVVNREPRLGESTVDPTRPDMWQEAGEALLLAAGAEGRVTLVDVTPINRTRNFHNFSLETPEFFDDLFARLTNDPAPRSRVRYRVTTESGAEYEVLTGGR